MNPQDPLENLHPLRQPDLIGWWPPAVGWWLLLFATILCLTAFIYVVLKRYRRNAYRRNGLRQLHNLQADYHATGDHNHYLSELNTLLKAVALIAHPRSDVAAIHGDAWRTFLNLSLSEDTQFGPIFSDAVYQKTCPELDVDQLNRSAHQWIKSHKVMP